RGRTPKGLTEERLHRFKHFRQYRRSRLMVQVNVAHKNTRQYSFGIPAGSNFDLSCFCPAVGFLSPSMLLCDEELMILAFLKTNPEAYFGGGEICRKAGNRKLAAKNPRWALPYLVTLRDKDMVEADPNGH